MDCVLLSISKDKIIQFLGTLAQVFGLAVELGNIPANLGKVEDLGEMFRLQVFEGQGCSLRGILVLVDVLVLNKEPLEHLLIDILWLAMIMRSIELFSQKFSELLCGDPGWALSCRAVPVVDGPVLGCILAGVGKPFMIKPGIGLQGHHREVFLEGV